MSRIRLLTVTALTMGLLGGMAPAAFAGDTPSPSPSPTFTRPVPTPQTCATRPITFAPTASPTDEVSPARPGATRPRRRPSTRSPLPPEQFVAQVTALGSTVVQNRVIARRPRLRHRVA